MFEVLLVEGVRGTSPKLNVGILPKLCQAQVQILAREHTEAERSLSCKLRPGGIEVAITEQPKHIRTS